MQSKQSKKSQFKTITVQDVDRPSPYGTCPIVDVQTCNRTINPFIIND